MSKFQTDNSTYLLHSAKLKSLTVPDAPSDFAHNSSDGGWCDGSALGNRRPARASGLEVNMPENLKNEYQHC